MSNAEIKISLSNHPIVRTPRISGGIFFVYISIDDLGSWNYQGLVIVTRCRKNSHSYFIKIGSTMGSGTAKKSISIVQKVFFPYLDCIYHQSVGCSCGSPTGYQGKHLTVIIIFNVFLFYVGVLVSLIQCFQ